MHIAAGLNVDECSMNQASKNTWKQTPKSLNKRQNFATKFHFEERLMSERYLLVLDFQSDHLPSLEAVRLSVTIE